MQTLVREYTVGWPEFQDAQRLWLRRSARARRRAFVTLRLMPAVGCVLLAGLVYDMAVRHFALPAWAAGLLFGLTYLCLCPLLLRPLQLRRLYKDMKDGRADNDPTQMELNEEELISRIPGRSEGRFRRAALRGFLEDERVFLVLVARKRFLVLPKHIMDETGWQQLRQWLGPPMLEER